MLRLLAGVLLLASAAFAANLRDDKDNLFEAARKGDVATVKALLDKGVDVNAKSDYGLTALGFAADNGHVEVVKLLLERKADVNATDTFYKATPLSWALMKQKPQPEVVKMLLTAGAKNENSALSLAISRNNPELLQAVIDSGRIKQETLDSALTTTPETKPVIIAVLKKAGAKVKPPEPKKPETDAAKKEPAKPADKPKEDATPKPPAVPVEPIETVKEPKPWPQFRGIGATGVADSQCPPLGWDATTGRHLRWKAPIPGLGLSCPTIWGDKVFVTTAIAKGNAKPALRTGQYGDVEPLKEDQEHTWKVYCLDTRNGQVTWERTAHVGVPKVKRHPKSSQANCTPATDGEHVIVCFGSEGLYCYTVNGELKWKKDLGNLASGWFFNPEYEWGFGSSPIIYRGLAIVQCDIGKDSFIVAHRVADGSVAWQTPREEIPSWATPTVIEPENGAPELVTSASKFARAYDPLTGTELWRLGPFSEITVPTPFLGQGLIFVASGYRPIQPIYAIKPGARGDISLKEKETTNSHIAWSAKRGGPYMPTPIVYGEHFYACSNAGILACYDAKTGKQLYSKRLGGVGGYTASAAAANGRLYFTGEDGVTRVVKAGETFELLAVNPLGEEVLATPAISNGMIFIRGREHLFAFGR
jgi:outer membrane protein assembly factor BamB